MRIRLPIPKTGAGLLWLVVLFGCTPAPIPRSSEQPSVAAAGTHPLVQPSCDEPPGPASPWVVNASEDQQQALARSRSRGSMVFTYDCGRPRLLEDCRAPGSYAYAATTPQPLAARMDDTDSYLADLPLTAATSPLGTGECLRLEALTIGVWSSTVRVTYADELEGACAGATHVARNVVVGTSRLRRDAAEPSSTTESRPFGEFGQRCHGAGGDSAPPTGCDDPVRLTLQPVLAERGPEAWVSDDAVLETAPEGASCMRASVVTCERDCEAGAAGDCVKAAIARGGDGAGDLYERACWLGDGQACSEAATVLLGGTRSEVGYVAWRRACEGGQSSWCWSLGMALSEGKLEGLEGFSAYDAWALGCRHGSPESCYAAAQWRLAGGAGRLSIEDLLGASCPEPSVRGGSPAGNWNGCMVLAGMLERGDGVERRPGRAAALYERVCDMKIRVGCREAARMAEGGVGGAVNRELAERMYGEACRLGEPEACMRAASLAGGEAGTWYEEGCRRFKHGPACERLKRR